MHNIERFLCDCIEHTEKIMMVDHIDHMTDEHKDYIAHCCDLCLKVMAVLTGKKAYDKYVSHDGINDTHHNPVHNNMMNTAMNL